MAKSKYDKEFPLRAEDYARQGMRDEDIAKKLGISEKTFYEYQKKYREFLQAIKRGKAPVDFEVENKLLQRCRGYEYEETHAEYNVDETGKKKALPSKIKIIKKQVAPDTTAIIFWLKNRRSKQWKDRKDIDWSGDLPVMFEISEDYRHKKKKEKEKEKVDDAGK